MQDTSPPRSGTPCGGSHEGVVPSQQDLLSASSIRGRPGARTVRRSNAAPRRPHVVRIRQRPRRGPSTGASTLRSEGFTERQAAFLVTVMLHAGVCMVRQYCAFAGSRTATTPASSSRAWSSGASPRRNAAHPCRAASTTSTIGGSTPPSASRTAASQATAGRPRHGAADDARRGPRPAIDPWLALSATSGTTSCARSDVAHPGVAAATPVRHPAARHGALLPRPTAHRVVEAGEAYTFLYLATKPSTGTCTRSCNGTPNGSGSTSRRSPPHNDGARDGSASSWSAVPPFAGKEVPTLEQFASRFMDGHARSNQLKPSGIAHKELVLEEPPAPDARRKASRRDHRRGRATAQVPAAAPQTSSGEQRAHRPEHDVEEGRRMARARPPIRDVTLVRVPTATGPRGSVAWRGRRHLCATRLRA